MRDIKFRVRSNGHVIGYESFFDGRWHWKTREGESWFLDYDGMYKAEGATREQFTGVLDGKGVEIYEADIMRIPYKTAYGVSKRKDWMYVSAIEFRDSMFVATGKGVLYKCRHGEVIGDIYQNKELLA